MKKEIYNFKYIRSSVTREVVDGKARGIEQWFYNDAKTRDEILVIKNHREHGVLILFKYP